MRKYATNPHTALLDIIALLFAGYQAAYPYLNPNNLGWQNAIIYSSMAIISALVLGHAHVTTQSRLARVEALLAKQDDGGPPTRRVASVDNPDKYLH